MSSNSTERFMDEPEKPIPPQDTWTDLSINSLIDVKSQLESKYWAFGNNPAIAKVLLTSIETITKMLAQR